MYIYIYTYIYMHTSMAVLFSKTIPTSSTSWEFKKSPINRQIALIQSGALQKSHIWRFR